MKLHPRTNLFAWLGAAVVVCAVAIGIVGSLQSRSPAPTTVPSAALPVAPTDGLGLPTAGAARSSPPPPPNPSPSAASALLVPATAIDRVTGTPQSLTETSWQLTANRGTIKGFADKVSAADKDQIHLFVTCVGTEFEAAVFRLGWYDNGAKQADLVATYSDLPCVNQPAPLVDPVTGLISADNWHSNALIVPNGWRTGIYLVKLIASNGDQNYIPLIIRDDVGRHDFLLVHASYTDEAYNQWGGKSLYGGSGATTISGSSAAVKVSFDRPYDGDGSGISIWYRDLNMVRWLESNGYDVGYASDEDVNRDPQFDRLVRAVIFVGHDEYWSKEMRDNLESVRDRGKGLGFFTGDTGSWAVRPEVSPLGVDRTLVCYRDANLDPIRTSAPSLVTTRWRLPPLNRPMQQFTGIGTFGAIKRSADWTATGVSSVPDLFTGTGFRDGDTVTNLVGYEYDGMWTPGASPQPLPGLQVLGEARVEAVNQGPETLNFLLRDQFPVTSRPLAGQLSTTIDATGLGLLYVHLVSAQGSLMLQYHPDDGSPRLLPHGQSPGDDYGILHYGKDFVGSGLKRFSRDLRADYRSVYGVDAPANLEVDAVEIQGSLKVGPLTFTAPDGNLTKITYGNPASTVPPDWHVASGKGTVTIRTGSPTSDSVLVTQTDVGERRSDEQHTVVVRDPGRGVIVAVGSVQWDWALDAYGDHRDDLGNVTPVDARVQALTRNILRALIRQ